MTERGFEDMPEQERGLAEYENKKKKEVKKEVKSEKKSFFLKKDKKDD